jgi:ABC-type polysaccharide/polyol phosphate transport system, ATPase component
MENEIAIKVENLTKIYKLYEKPEDRLKEALNPFRKSYHKDFYALRDISFDIFKGEAVGIIGKNGSGKSTLLKIITGVLSPTSGKIKPNGRISALLELGAGFNPEYTGIENIYLNGTINGYTKEEMDQKMHDILEFADIGEFIKQPVKKYSSGMFVRLAFSVAINIDPELLIIDEALSVGDIRFQQKCLRKIEEFSREKTVLFVTHDMGVINKFCNRVIWINEGEVVEDGDPNEISKKYQAFMTGTTLSKLNIKDENKSFNETVSLIELSNQDLDVLGDNKAQIIGVGLFDKIFNERLSIVRAGDEINLLIRVRFSTQIFDTIVGFTIKDRLGNIVTQSNSFVLDEEIEKCEAGQVSTFCFNFTMPNLNDGTYTISPAIASGTQEEHAQHSWVHDAVIFQVVSFNTNRLQGYIFMDTITFKEVK